MKRCLAKGAKIVFGATGALLIQRPSHEMQMKGRPRIDWIHWCSLEEKREDHEFASNPVHKVLWASHFLSLFQHFLSYLIYVCLPIFSFNLIYVPNLV